MERFLEFPSILTAPETQKTLYLQGFRSEFAWRSRHDSNMRPTV
jgi:hypothetical protein